MTKDFLVLDKIKLLELFTVDYIHFRQSKNINEKIADNEYTIIKYSNNGKTHYKRKYIQTYKNSVLTNSKYFECLYIFSFDFIAFLLFVKTLIITPSFIKDYLRFT